MSYEEGKVTLVAGVSKAVRRAVRIQASEQDISMSKWFYNLIISELKKTGFVLDDNEGEK